jgi:hypothetical protein
VKIFTTELTEKGPQRSQGEINMKIVRKGKNKLVNSPSFVKKLQVKDPSKTQILRGIKSAIKEVNEVKAVKRKDSKSERIFR